MYRNYFCSQEQKPPDVAEWSEHKNTDGRSYFYNSNSMESVWEKPKIMADWEGLWQHSRTYMYIFLELLDLCAIENCRFSTETFWRRVLTRVVHNSSPTRRSRVGDEF